MNLSLPSTHFVWTAKALACIQVKVGVLMLKWGGVRCIFSAVAIFRIQGAISPVVLRSRDSSEISTLESTAVRGPDTLWLFRTVQTVFNKWSTDYSDWVSKSSAIKAQLNWRITLSLTKDFQENFIEKIKEICIKLMNNSIWWWFLLLVCSTGKSSSSKEKMLLVNLPW